VAAETDAPWLVRYWWVFPAVLVATALAVGATHRERPLTLDDTVPQVRQVLDTPSHPVGQQDWRQLEVLSDRSFSPTHGPMVRSEVRTRWERLSGHVFRRADDWYDVGGSKALYQERTVSWLGLLGLRWVAREPAPIFHDILEDAGWLGDRTLDVTSLRVDPDFPLREGAGFSARAMRQVDPIPGASKAGPATREHQVTCRAAAPLASVSGLETLQGSWFAVDCETQTRSEKETVGTPTSRRRLAYSTQLGLYILLHHDEVEPRSPFDAENVAPRWSSTTVRYRSAVLAR
jgi:hypothetical protein